MKWILTGADGQLGREFLRLASSAGLECLALSHRMLDITDPAAVAECLRSAHGDCLVNCAAYTAVDRAEMDSGAAWAAWAVNARAVGILAEETKRNGMKLIHVSTDYVFDGVLHRPYCPDDLPNPLNVYGRSKLAGEQLAFSAGASDVLVVRTSWLYSAFGKNFVKTILRLLTEQSEINVIDDQIGSPCSAGSLARTLYVLAEKGRSGLLHWTNGGEISWYEFAVAIREEALAMAFLDRAATINAVSTAQYPLPARRPSYSVLNSSASGVAVPDWREELKNVLRQIGSQQCCGR